MMEFGVLSDMLDVKKKALKKLFKQQVMNLHFKNSFFFFRLILYSRSYRVSLFLIHILSLSMFRVPIDSSFYRRTRKW